MEKHKFNIFPEIVGEDFELLKGDIKNNGYDERYPIYTFEGKILDGWNRYRICKELEVTPTYKEFEGSGMEALEFVMRTNKRRNLTSSQWAVIAIDSEEIVEAIQKQAKERKTFGKKLPKVERGETSIKLSEMFNTNKQYIKEVAKIKKENPADLDLIRSGSKTISEYKQQQKKMKFLEGKQTFLNDVGGEGVVEVKVGDCLEVLKDEEREFDLILSDPPYAMDYKSGWNDWDKIEGDKREDTIGLLDGAFKLSADLLKDDGHIYIFGNINEIDTVKPIFQKYFKLKNILIWDRGVIGMGDLKTYGRSYDVVYFGYNKTLKPLNGNRDRDILQFERVSPNNLIHPTEKPSELLEYLVKKSTQKGDWVLDMFAGSGSTLVASKKLGRNSLGIELDEKYIKHLL